MTTGVVIRTRLITWTMLVAALLSVAVWLSPFGTVGDADALTCGPATTSRAAIALVVDFGDSPPEDNCVAVPMTSSGSTSATGIDALRAAGYRLRIEGGFLCAIEGQPATGCATGSGFDGWYWRYFKAEPGKTWKYSSVGFGYRMALVNGCAAEGWVWSDQPAGAVAPRGGVPTLRCHSLPAATTTTRAPATTAPAPPKTSGGASGGSPGGAVSGGPSSNGGAGPDAATGIDLQPGSSPGGAVDGSQGSAGDQDGGSEPFTGAAGAGGPGGGAAAGAADAQVKGAAADSKAAESAEAGRSSKDSESASARRSQASSSGGSGSAVGVAVALVLVAGLGLFGAMKARGRRLAEKV